MNDLNFKHCANKNEREDEREDRKNNVKENSLLEVNEPCWMQFQKDSLKMILSEVNINESRQ